MLSLLHPMHGFPAHYVVGSSCACVHTRITSFLRSLTAGTLHSIVRMKFVWLLLQCYYFSLCYNSTLLQEHALLILHWPAQVHFTARCQRRGEPIAPRSMPRAPTRASGSGTCAIGRALCRKPVSAAASKRIVVVRNPSLGYDLATGTLLLTSIDCRRVCCHAPVTRLWKNH